MPVPRNWKKKCNIINARHFSPLLSHIDDHGKLSMVDVGNKNDTIRIAKASGRISIGKEAFLQVANNSNKKGDVLGVARIAGIQAAKTTALALPLCHNIPLSKISLDLTLDSNQHAVDICSTVSCTGKTGVEMEALHAVSIAALTIYDMCKAVSHEMVISDIQLDSKTGGKSSFSRQVKD
jgi:molybdenum cofactor biosynthesis protein MoaC